MEPNLVRGKTTSCRVAESVFWAISASNLLKVGQRFEGSCHRHLHGQRLSQARSHHEAGDKQRLHAVISQKREMLESSAFRTSEPRACGAVNRSSVLNSGKAAGTWDRIPALRHSAQIRSNANWPRHWRRRWRNRICRRRRKKIGIRKERSWKKRRRNKEIATKNTHTLPLRVCMFKKLITPEYMSSSCWIESQTVLETFLVPRVRRLGLRFVFLITW